MGYNIKLSTKKGIKVLVAFGAPYLLKFLFENYQAWINLPIGTAIILFFDWLKHK